MDKKYDLTRHDEIFLQKFDAMCLLPLNMVNEKVFLVLWFWFIILTTCSALALIYRLSNSENYLGIGNCFDNSGCA